MTWLFVRPTLDCGCPDVLAAYSYGFRSSSDREESCAELNLRGHLREPGDRTEADLPGRSP